MLGLTLIDHHHDVSDLLKIIHSFISLYQLLPSPLVAKRLEKLYQAESYGELRVQAITSSEPEKRKDGSPKRSILSV